MYSIPNKPILAVLDPRYKLQWYHLAGWKKTWINNCTTMIRKVWNANYKSSSDTTTSQEGTDRAESHAAGLKGAILEKFRALREENPVDELSRYLSEHTESFEAIQKLSEENGGRDGVLCWWKVSTYANTGLIPNAVKYFIINNIQF